MENEPKWKPADLGWNTPVEIEEDDEASNVKVVPSTTPPVDFEATRPAPAPQAPTPQATQIGNVLNPDQVLVHAQTMAAAEAELAYQHLRNSVDWRKVYDHAGAEKDEALVQRVAAHAESMERRTNL